MTNETDDMHDRIAKLAADRDASLQEQRRLNDQAKAKLVDLKAKIDAIRNAVPETKVLNQCWVSEGAVGLYSEYVDRFKRGEWASSCIGPDSPGPCLHDVIYVWYNPVIDLYVTKDKYKYAGSRGCAEQQVLEEYKDALARWVLDFYPDAKIKHEKWLNEKGGSRS